MAGYSWQRHLIRHGAYGDWVDRGRIRSAHRQWSAYLREVADAAGAEIACGVVTGLAIGFDGRWFETLLGEDASARYRDALGGGELERVIDVDLSVAGLAPQLHLPVMAGLAQGPGFSNLSCLGLLSDRILRRYVAVSDAGALVPQRRKGA